MKILRFEALETPVVCSSLFDQGYTEVKLIKVVKNFVDSRHHLTVFQVRLFSIERASTFIPCSRKASFIVCCPAEPLRFGLSSGNAEMTSLFDLKIL